jgi:hypothetical protein
VAPIIIGEGGPADPERLPLSTKKKTLIPNARRQESPPEKMRAAEAYVHAQCPNVLTRSLSATYNCVGMVFAARRTWVDTDHISRIFEDDGYRPCQGRADIMAGDIVVYRKDLHGPIQHVGVIVRPLIDQASWLVLSQFGSDGEYFHSENEVPLLYGDRKEFLTERRIL